MRGGSAVSPYTFLLRPQTTDSHDYYSTDKLIEKCLDKDLERLNIMTRLVRQSVSHSVLGRAIGVWSTLLV